MGRPTLYNAKLHDLWAWSLAIEGKTVREIAKEFGVAQSTIFKWMEESETFSEALKSGRAAADAAVEKCLYERATGYTITRKHVKKVKDASGNTVQTVEEIHEVMAPPNTTAMIFWLKNRQPERWRRYAKEQTEETALQDKPVLERLERWTEEMDRAFHGIDGES